VVATDVNQRALAFTAINAALNGLDNVETRLGSLFEPVKGETFDLITCNAPYVVSPEDRWQYRDAAGFEADQLSQTVVTQCGSGRPGLVVSKRGFFQASTTTAKVNVSAHAAPISA